MGGGNLLVNQIVKLLLFRGGYLGVDIFLVVSGFLICTSILNSHAIPNHQFSLIHFYKRRFYRLSLPLIPLIIFCAVLGYFVLAPNIFHELLKETARALTFVSNQYFAKQGGYFALNSLDKILLHTWYLSLIGQFYIVFPLVVILINKLLGQRYLKAAIFALTIFTFAYAEQKFILTKADNLYYLSTMRAWELLFGASLAFIKVNLNHKKLWFYVGICLLTAQIIFTEDQNYNPLAILFVALATAIVIIANYQDSRLNNRGVQFVGKSSYSLYLWHWPIMVFCSRLMIFEATWFVVTLIIITWLLSYRFEKIDKKYFFWASISYLIILSLTITAILPISKESQSDSNQIKDLNYGMYALLGLGKTRNIIVDKTKDINTLMIGDSNLTHYLPFLTNKINLKFIELHGSLNYGENVKATDSSNFSLLSEMHSNIMVALKQMPKGSSVVLSNNWQLYSIPGELFKKSDSRILVSSRYKSDIFSGIVADLEKMIQNYPYLNFYIISQGYRPKTIELTPFISGYYLGKRYEYVIKIRNLLGCELKDSFRPNNLSEAKVINQKIQNLTTKYQNAFYIDRNLPVCNENYECKFVENGNPLYSDINHLSIYGGEIVGKYILKKLQEVK